MAVFLLSLLGVAEMIVGGAIQFFGWPHRWLGFMLMALGALTGLLTWQVYEEERTDWQLTVQQQAALGKQIRGTLEKFPVPIFWNQSDQQSKNYSDHLLLILRTNGWNESVKVKEADITQSVIGVVVVKSRQDERPPPNAIYLKKMLGRAGIETPKIRNEHILSPGQVGIQIGRQPKWSIEDLWPVENT